MSVIAYSIIRPHVNKRSTVEERVRKAGGIYVRLGAEVRISKIVAGPFADCIVFQRKYSNFAAAGQAFMALAGDEEAQQLQALRESDPAADFVIGRDINRTVFGDVAWDTHPISHLRIYEIGRDKLADALAMFPEVEKMTAPAGVNLVGLAPVTGENMSSLTVTYQFKSVEHWAEQLDGMGTSEEFQALVARAGELGALRLSGVMMPL